MRRIAFSVEQRHIDAGTRRDCTGCAIALALAQAAARELGTHATVSVWPSMMGHPRVHVNGYPGRLSVRANQFALAYDRGEPVEPFEDTLFVEDMP